MPDDSMMYSGVDKEPDGVFDNEPEEEEDEESKAQSKLTSGEDINVEVLFGLFDKEIKKINKISELPWAKKATEMPKEMLSAKLEAIANYISFIEEIRQLITSVIEKKKNGKREKN